MELTVVVPTFNERENIAPLVERLIKVLAGTEWEVVFVDDDSPDGTAEVVRQLAQTDRRVRCVQRIGRRGLSSACIEGMLTSAAPFLAVMDADLQHDEGLLPRMLDEMRGDGLDIVVGSRYVEGGGVGGWSRLRVGISALAGRLSRYVVKADIADPMSGFFMIRRDTFEREVRRLSAQGFKILLDLFASSPTPLRFKELPFQFRLRLHGESKLDTLVAWEYINLLLDKLIGHVVPVRFLMFAMVGGLGIGVHLAALSIGLHAVGLRFSVAQGVATMVAMTGNFILNNVFTYRDQRLRGRGLVWGLLSFYAVCGLGAAANVGIASFIYRSDEPWWLAGLAGAMVGSVWNYAMSSVFTWKRRR
jgi:dolichol-phosphate mannosyltransferase